MAFGAKGWSLTRTIEDPLHFRQASLWESREDFERYWYSDEISPCARRRSTTTTSPSFPSGT